MASTMERSGSRGSPLWSCRWARGGFPWVALALAVAFGAYGLAKKRSWAPAVSGLVAEMAMLFPLAMIYLLTLDLRGDGAFGHAGWRESLLLAVSGIVTMVPLVMFVAAAARVKLATLGLLQYLEPTVLFVLVVAVFHEHVAPLRLAGLVVVWIALASWATDAWRAARLAVSCA